MHVGGSSRVEALFRENVRSRECRDGLKAIVIFQERGVFLLNLFIVIQFRKLFIWIISRVSLKLDSSMLTPRSFLLKSRFYTHISHQISGEKTKNRYWTTIARDFAFETSCAALRSYFSYTHRMPLTTKCARLYRFPVIRRERMNPLLQCALLDILVRCIECEEWLGFFHVCVYVLIQNRDLMTIDSASVLYVWERVVCMYSCGSYGVRTNRERKGD